MASAAFLAFSAACLAAAAFLASAAFLAFSAACLAAAAFFIESSVPPWFLESDPLPFSPLLELPFLVFPLELPLLFPVDFEPQGLSGLLLPFPCRGAEFD